MTKNILVLDSTQISSFLECPAKWQFSHKEHLTLSTDVREDFAMGTYGHKLLEIFYENKKQGKSIDKAAQCALSFDFDQQTLNCSHGPEEDHSNNCEFVHFPLADKTREAVRQRFNEYWMVYSSKDIEPQIVEKGFSYELLNDKHNLFVLEGRIDIFGLFDMVPCYMDHKFQGRRHDLYSKSIQFRNYALATNSRLGIINYIRLAKEVSNKTFERKVISFSAMELEQWRRELISIYQQIAYQISLANEFHDGQMTQNFGSCAGRYGYPCAYTPICEEYNKDVKQSIKKNLFKVGEEWKPW